MTKRIKLEDNCELWIDFEEKYDVDTIKEELRFYRQYNPDSITLQGQTVLRKTLDKEITGRYVPASAILVIENQSVTIPNDAIVKLFELKEELNKNLPKCKLNTLV